MTPSGRGLSFEERLQIGKDYEAYVVRRLRQRGIEIDVRDDYGDQLRHGDTTRGLEIKQDHQFRTTGNLFIEVAARRTPNDVMRPKGIYMCDTSHLLGIGDYRTMWVFSKATLRDVYESAPWITFAKRTIATAEGFVIKVSHADDLALRKIEFPDTDEYQPAMFG